MGANVVEKWEGFSRGEMEFLQDGEYQTVIRAMKEIEGSANSLLMGKRLEELSIILRPYGYFTKAFMALKLLHRTTYGYRHAYLNAMATLPAGAVDALLNQPRLVITANRNPLGEWGAAIELVPPPATGTPATYARWADRMIAAKPKRAAGHSANRVTKDPNQALIECYRFIERTGKRLPPQPAARKDFARNLIRYTMKQFDLKPDKFTPAEIPQRLLARK